MSPPPSSFLYQLSSRFPELYETALTHPAIDNHAHPLLRSTSRNVLPFEGIISEAEGDAKDDAIYSVAARRAAKQLGDLFGLDFTGTDDGTHSMASDKEVEKSKWQRIKDFRAGMDYEALCRVSFDAAGIHAILIDDGLGGGPGGMASLTEGYPWHDNFTALGRTKRIVRVEVEAEGILRSLFSAGATSSMSTDGLLALLHDFERGLDEKLRSVADHADVVGFKSIVCYRTGLDVQLSSRVEDKLAGIEELLGLYKKEGKLRLASKALNDEVVRMTLEIAGEKGIPVQFHTGLGDTDIRLTRSSPAHMQPLIESYSQTKIVILHGAYPYTRDAGYLAAVYKNVYLDFGEIFPFVSSAGQRSVVRQVLELTPTNKILWSSDGHWWPESYYLGIYQARLALFEVLADMVVQDELTQSAAVKIVKDALYNNSERLYQL